MTKRRPSRRKQYNICEDISQSAAILCSHVAKREYPLLRARRDPKAFPEDSGWQFLCNRDVEEDEDEAQMWAVHEVLTLEPSLASFINEPAGILMVRKDEKSKWEVFRFDPTKEPEQNS